MEIWLCIELTVFAIISMENVFCERNDNDVNENSNRLINEHFTGSMVKLLGFRPISCIST